MEDYDRKEGGRDEKKVEREERRGEEAGERTRLW